jgi:hypothetical protein
MRKLFALLLFLATASPCCAQATVTPDPTGLNYVSITAGTAVTVPAIYFFGAANWSSVAQVSSLTCYNAATATGTPVYFSPGLGIGAGQPWLHGVFMSSGSLTCQASGIPLGNGYMVYYQ